MTLEAALKELNIKASTEENGKRRPCQCQGTYYYTYIYNETFNQGL